MKTASVKPLSYVDYDDRTIFVYWLGVRIGVILVGEASALYRSADGRKHRLFGGLGELVADLEGAADVVVMLNEMLCDERRAVA